MLLAQFQQPLIRSSSIDSRDDNALDSYDDETEIRKISQTDSLIVYCGGYWDSSCKVVNGMKIPKQCWKVVYSLSQKKVIYCFVFTNTDTPIKTDYSLENLEGMLGYSIGIPESKKLKIKKK